MTATFDHDKIVAGFRDALAQVLAEKEEATQLEEADKLLKTAEQSIGQLTTTLENKDTELAASAEAQEELKAKLEELQAKHAELEEQLAASNKNASTFEERASTAEQKLADIEKAEKLAIRMNELAEAKVVSSDEGRRQAQAVRVRDMNDEEFAAFKQELVELRDNLMAEIADSKETASEVEVAEGDEPSADNEKTRREQAAAAAAAALNIEVASDDLKAKYAKFGVAMAARIQEAAASK